MIISISQYNEHGLSCTGICLCLLLVSLCCQRVQITKRSVEVLCPFILHYSSKILSSGFWLADAFVVGCCIDAICQQAAGLQRSL